MQPSRLRRIVLLGVAAAGLVLATALATLYLSGSHGLAVSGRIGLLRAAFDQAADECYRRFDDSEAHLQACLAGVMSAHLQALGGADGPSGTGETPPADLGLSCPPQPRL